MFPNFKALVAGVVVVLGATEHAAFAQSQAHRTTENRSQIVRTNRTRIETVTRTATNNRYEWSSRDREGRLASPAHRAGAVDFVPRVNAGYRSDLHRDAASIARQLGTHHTVIVEQKQSPISGRRYDVQTTYKVLAPLRGVQVNTYRVPARATGTHIHVQPSARFVPGRTTTTSVTYSSSSSSSRAAR